MKFNINYLLMILFLSISSMSYAQKTNEQNSSSSVSTNETSLTEGLIGYWQLRQIIYENKAPVNANLGSLKVYQADKNFVNINITQQGYIISHAGTYNFLDNGTIQENIQKLSTRNNANMVNQTVGLKVKLLENGVKLSIKYKIKTPDGKGETETEEIWARVAPLY